MATMTVQFNDDCGSYGYIKDETVVLDFLKKFGDEIGVLKDNFYKKWEGGIYILSFLNDEFFSTDDSGDLSLSVFKLLGRLSDQNGDRRPGFSLGQEGFSNEFYSELYKILNDIDDEISLGCTVSGGGDGYFDVSYELQPDGWIVYADLYEEENEDW